MPYTLGETWYYFVFFLPGIVTFQFGSHLLEALWSIGVEEIFYLIWAPMIKYLRNNILFLLVSVVLFKLILGIAVLLFPLNELLVYLIKIHEFEAMAIGGLGAYLLFTYGEKFTQLLIFKVPAQIVVFTILGIYLLFHTNINNIYWNVFFKTPIVTHLIIITCFLYLILCVSIIDTSILKLRGKVLFFLGEISYGIYMYHIICIFGTIFLLENYLKQINPIASFLLFYGIVITVTIIVSSLSKLLFENYFLRFKNKL